MLEKDDVVKIKIVNIIDKIIQEYNGTGNDFSGIGTNIFEIASSNKYYSKIYAND